MNQTFLFIDPPGWPRDAKVILSIPCPKARPHQFSLLSQGYLLFPNLTGDRSYPALCLLFLPGGFEPGNEWLRLLHSLDSLLAPHICQALLGRELKEIQRQRSVCGSAQPYSTFSTGLLNCILSTLQCGEVDPICKELNAGFWLIAVLVPRRPGRDYVSLIWKKRTLNSTCLLDLQHLFFFHPTFFSSPFSLVRGMKGNRGSQPAGRGLTDGPVFV